MNELTATNKHFREEYILCSIRYIKKLKEFCSENNDTINSIYELFADNIEFFSTFIDKSKVSTSLRELEKNLIMKNIKKETKKETKINPSHIKNAIECLFLFELLEKDKDEINITENDLNDDDKIHEVIQKLLCFKNEDILLKLTQAILVFHFGKNASSRKNITLSTPKKFAPVFYSARESLDKQGWDKKLFSSAIISLLYSDFLLYGVCDLFDDNIFKNHHAFSSIKNEKFLKDYFCLDDEKQKNEIIIPTIEEMLNVIPVHFTYVVELSSKGTKNTTFANLKKIIEENKTCLEVGKDAAQKVKIDTALALNDFYTQDGSLVSVKTNEGGFVTLVTALAPEIERNTWRADMLITNVKRVEADPEKNIDKDYLTIRGAIFNFRNALLPMEFTLRDERGFSYFENLDVSDSNPIFTQVWGLINCESKVVTWTEESAFGEPTVRTTKTKSKEWLITGTFPESKVYEFGTEETMTAEDIQKAEDCIKVKKIIDQFNYLDVI